MNSTMVDAQSVVTIIKDVATVVFYAIASVVALAGLKAWRREHIGKAHYELAKSILTITYKIRGRVNEQRSRFTMESDWSHEEPAPGDTENFRERKAKAVRSNHERVREQVYVLFAEMQPLLLEADVVLGTDSGIRQAADEIEACYSSLNSAVSDYLPLLRAERLPADESFKDLRRIVYRKGNPPGEDKFENSFQAVVHALEKTLSPYLRK